MATDLTTTGSSVPEQVLPEVQEDAARVLILGGVASAPDAFSASEPLAAQIAGQQLLAGALHTADVGAANWLMQAGAGLVALAGMRDESKDASALGLTGVTYSIGYTAWLDIAPEGVTKATGLAYVADRLGVDAADVLAIGDGRNDIEMLSWAGRGVTFSDSPPEVLSAAVDGRGGGKADLAQGSGKNPAGIDAALEALRAEVARS